MPDPILNIARLKAFYGDFQALYGLDLHLGEGEVLAIIGANGAGKTTLLRSIAGLMQNGADQIAGPGVALVPEGRQLFPSLKVEENLQIGGRVGRSGRGRWMRSTRRFRSSRSGASRPRPRCLVDNSRWSPSGRR